MPFYLAWESLRALVRGAPGALAWLLVLTDRALGVLAAPFRWLFWPMRQLLMLLADLVRALSPFARTALSFVARALWMPVGWLLAFIIHVAGIVEPALNAFITTCWRLLRGLEPLRQQLAAALASVLRAVTAVGAALAARARTAWQVAARAIRTAFEAWRRLSRHAQALARLAVAALAAALAPMGRAFGQVAAIAGRALSAIARNVRKATRLASAVLQTAWAATRLASAVLQTAWAASRTAATRLLSPVRLIWSPVRASWRVARRASSASRSVVSRAWAAACAVGRRSLAPARAAAADLRAELRRILRR